MAVRLNFSSNSVRNTTVSNNGPGIYYAVSTTSGITSVMRWDRWANVNVLVGQFELSMFGSPRVRLGFYDEWRLMGDFLYIGVRGLWSKYERVLLYSGFRIHTLTVILCVYVTL